MTTSTASFHKLLNLYVSRIIPDNNKNIYFDQDSFDIYMLIEGEENLHKIYEKSKIGQQSFTQAVRKLFEQGLISEVSDITLVDNEKLDIIKSSLAVYVGPVAKMIVEDAFEALGFSENHFPAHLMPSLIEKITDQVPFEQAVEFKQEIEEMMALYN